MNQPTGHAAIPLSVPNLQKQQLTHYAVTVRQGGDTEVRDYLLSGYQVDPAGDLHLVVNNMIVCSIAAGQWLEAGRLDVVGEVR